MGAIADVYVSVLADTDKAEQQIAGMGGSPGVRAAGTKTGKTFGTAMAAQVGKETKGIGSKIGAGLGQAKGGLIQGLGLAGGLGIAGLVTTAVAGVVGVIGDATQAASDLQETVGKVNVVFGKGAPEILAWGENAATSLGQSKQQALEAAGTYGNLFVSMGLGTQKAGEMSMSLVELATDLASFNNSSPEEALQALRSGLTGETEPLKRFGINLNEATLKQKALDLGLIDSTTGTLPAAVKAQAAYALAMEQSKTAQGDFARTSGGLANQQRIASAKISDAMAKLGQKIMPIVAKILPMLVDGFSFLIDILGTVIDAVSPLIDLFIDLVKVLAPIAKFIIDVVVSGFKVLGDVIGGVVDFIRNAVRAVVGFAASIPGPWQDAAIQVRDSLDKMEEDAKTTATEIPAQTAGALESGSTAVTAGAEAMVDGVPGAVGGSLAAGEGTVTGGAEDMVSGVPGVVGGMAADAKSAAAKTPGEMADGLRSQRNEIDSAFSQLRDDIKHQLSPAKEIAHLEGILTSKRLAKGLKSKDEVVRQQAQATRDLVTARLAELKGKSQMAGSQAGKALASGVQSQKGTAKTAAQQLSNAVAGPLTGTGKDSRGWGARTAQAYADGLRSKQIAVRNAARAVAQQAVSIFRATSPPGPDSPLHLIDVWGERTGLAFSEGLADGLQQQEMVLRALQGVGEQISVAPSSLVANGSSAAPIAEPARAGVGGDTYNIEVPVQGLLRARNPLEVAQQLSRLASDGFLTPRRKEVQGA